MTELKQNPAFNDFVKNQMISDARDILDHVNGALDKWNLSQYKLTGESVAFVVDAVRFFLESMHELTDQKKFILEFGPIDVPSVELRRAQADLTMKDFICSKLKDQFMQYAPQNVVRAETLQLEPAVKILALQLLDKTMQRQLNVVVGKDNEYQKLFIEHGADISFPTAYSFVYAVGEVFIRVQNQRGIILGAQHLDHLVRDFYMGEIPKNMKEPITVADNVFIELRDRMNIIAKATKPKPANDING